MNYSKKQLNLANNIEKALTFWVTCATLISEYTGIVVYFFGQKSRTSLRKVVQKNKKQNKKISYPKIGYLITQFEYSAGISHSGISVSKAANGNAPQFNIYCALKSVVMTFCFLWERLFVSLQRSTLYKTKIKINKNKNHDSRILPASRHFAGNRPQQNNCHQMGRRGINPQSPQRQSWLEMLHQASSRRNLETSQGNKLFPRWSSNLHRELKRASTCLSLLSFLISNQVIKATNKIKIYTTLRLLSQAQ